MDSNIVKIWYYQPENPPYQNKGTASELYCRIAATIANICATDANSENRILSDLREYLLSFVNRI